MIINKLVLFSMFILTFYTHQKMEDRELNKYEGLWQFDKMAPDSANQMTLSGLTDQYTFLVQKGKITLSLFSDNLTNWKSEDDVYLLITKWQNNTLLYLPPFGDWTPLADFDGEIFYMSDGKQKKLFRKITEEEIVVWNKAILKKDRMPYEYDLHKSKNH